MKKNIRIFNQQYLVMWILAGEIAVMGTLIKVLHVTPKLATGWLEKLSSYSFAIPMIILLYCLASFISLPQILLSTGVWVSFGLVKGSIIVWVSILIAASVNYWVGKKYGTRLINKMGKGKLADKILLLMERHGFMTSFSSRIIPSGSFLLINMAAGIKIRYFDFITGTAIGIIPKISILAFATEGVKGRITGKNIEHAMLHFGAAIFCAIVFIALYFYLRKKQQKIRASLT